MQSTELFKRLFIELYKNHYERLGDNPEDGKMIEATQIELKKFEKDDIVLMFSEFMILNDEAQIELGRLSEQLAEQIEKEKAEKAKSGN